MGQRANLIIVEEGSYTLYYSHWSANTLPHDLFWGPEHACNFIRAQQTIENGIWLDNIWAEGGALVDLRAREFVLYGGEDLLRDVPLRKAYLQMLGRAWQGWDVSWAHEGIAELADHVGYPRDKVLDFSDQDAGWPGNLGLPLDKEYIDIACSIQLTQNDLRLYPLFGLVWGFLGRGPDILDDCTREPGFKEFEWESWSPDFPASGFHIDVPNKRLELWMAEDDANVTERLAMCWPGWRVHWHRDAYEFQLKRTRNALRFPQRAPEKLREEVTELLLMEDETYDEDPMRRMMRKLASEGDTVAINPMAMIDSRVEMPIHARRSIIQKVMRDGFLDH